MTSGVTSPKTLSRGTARKRVVGVPEARSLRGRRNFQYRCPLHRRPTPLQNGLAGVAPRTRGARERGPVVHRWHYTEMAIYSNLRCPDLFPFLQIVVNARLEMNCLQFSVSLSYEVMDPMKDFR